MLIDQVFCIIMANGAYTVWLNWWCMFSEGFVVQNDCVSSHLYLKVEYVYWFQINNKSIENEWWCHDYVLFIAFWLINVISPCVDICLNKYYISMENIFFVILDDCTYETWELYIKVIGHNFQRSFTFSRSVHASLLRKMCSTLDQLFFENLLNFYHITSHRKIYSSLLTIFTNIWHTSLGISPNGIFKQRKKIWKTELIDKTTNWFIWW